ncbi:Hsp20/alpha crystallin family protein [bacterium]|nr:Hsp20/alpha crystallin family protein [bacterium]
MNTLIELKGRMERILASFFMNFNERAGDDPNIITPSADSFLDNNQQHIFLDLPSLNESSISLNIRDNSLLFQGEKMTEHTDCDDVFVHIERNVGSYMKMIPLAKEEDEYSALSTAYTDGVLHIVITFGG